MAGLPARGKSILARRILTGLEQLGIRTAIFNNGDIRRRLFGEESSRPEFFDPANREAYERRIQIEKISMEGARQWLATKGDVAIVDATHGTRKQRDLLRDYLNDYPVLFIECVNNDEELLEDFIKRKTQLPEFASMTPSEARKAFLQRLHYYESVYDPFCEETDWMRVDVADFRILIESSESTIPYYSAIRSIANSRWVSNLYLVRHGETEYNRTGRIGGDSGLSSEGKRQAQLLARYFRGVSLPYVFTSRKRRSIETASCLFEGRSLETMISLDEFDELDAGMCDGMTYAEMKALMPLEYAARAANKYRYTYPKGESYAMLQKRVARGLRRALVMAGDGALMIVGHQAVNRTILSLFLNQRTADIPYMYIPQNQFFRLTITQGKKLVEMIRYA